MKLQPNTYNSLESGLITKLAVSKYKMPLSSVSLAVNMHFDQIGSARLRKGSTQLGNTISGTDILGMHDFRDSGTGSNNQLIAVNGTVAYYLSSNTTFVSKREGLTSGKKARFTTFLDYAWMVNNSEATAIWDGNTSTSFLTSGNASGAPIGKFIENFRSRMWILGNDDYPDRVWYSSLPSSVTTPIVTWDTSVTTGDWIDISPSDGENITGSKRTKRSLLVFKQNHIYRIYSIGETDPDPQINVGTYSHESIVEAKDGVYFHHPTGFYKYIDGGVQEISKPVKDIVEAITFANYTDIAGWIEAEGDALCWSIGDITIYGDVIITNAVVRYTISTQAWTLYSYASKPTVGMIYTNPILNTREAIWGNGIGEVMRHNVGTTDDGTTVRYEIIHRPILVDGLNITEKNIESIMFLHDGKGSGTNVQWQKENDLESDWTKSLGELEARNTIFSNANIRGNEITFRISGVSEGEPFSYNGFDIGESQDDINYAK